MTCQLLISGSGVRNPDGALQTLQTLFSETYRLRGAVYARLIAASRRSARCRGKVNRAVGGGRGQDRPHISPT